MRRTESKRANLAGARAGELVAGALGFRTCIGWLQSAERVTVALSTGRVAVCGDSALTTLTPCIAAFAHTLSRLFVAYLISAARIRAVASLPGIQVL